MFAALFVFLFFLMLWIWAAFLLNSAYAESLPFSLGLRSRLAADYSPGEFSGSQGVFRLSIFNEVFHDLGLSPEEAEERSEEIKIAMGSPVPTATARNFEGDDPFTATPTPQPTSTATSTLTETPVPTSTYRPTKTPKPTKEPKIDPSDTPLPAFSATPTKCWVNPVIEILDPPDGVTYNDGDDIPAQAFAYDPDNVDPDTCQQIGVYPSDDGVGIEKVEFMIYWVDGGDILVHSQDQLSVKYCGFTGTSSCNTHPVNSPYWPDGFTPINDGLHKLKVRAKDDGDNYSDWVWVYFTINTGPAPTPTPTNTPTETPTPDCSTITINGFGTDEDRAYWTINNGSSTDITIDEIYLNWPLGDGELDYVKLGPLDFEKVIWNEDGHESPDVNITSGWTGESRVIPLSASMRLIFDFDLDPAADDEYTLSVGFAENSCTPLFSN